MASDLGLHYLLRQVCLNTSGKYSLVNLTVILLNPDMPYSVDPDQLASEEANWSGAALSAIKYVNL